ncbi:hypothetical protein [Desulfotignum phosphitoxidans]|uniref:Uncharacterized protein n=1 Tax=Desulfotignum phosphitoxidans DSM 13687 TaxID=1286635 RepID=S0FXJ2_9BACT|nr:hypothetical protein [Desulfotignum phosphitoxidans]EMS79460.1 hypothetical protein Dpo_4c00070 [Desulfotignum phosphitoxidans DSM 13687]
MSDVLNKIRDFMEKQGIPGRDGYDLAASGKAFADGANFRIEIAGVERATTMESMIKEADRRNIVIHRAIAAVGGSTYCDFAELKDMAQMAKDAQIEVIMTVGHRKGWDTGAKEMTTSEGQMQGFRLRGSDNISFHIADIMRNIEAGFRGFLVYDEGVLFILNKMREQGLIPKETIFKFSVFGGYCSAAGAKVVESMGANSLNPISDVSLPILSSIRKAVNIPLDIYTIIVNSFGGNFRGYECPEIAKVASPCYFKFEPGTSEGDIYMPWVTEAWHAGFIKEKVKIAAIVMELMERHAPEMKTSPKGAKDLVLTKP